MREILLPRWVLYCLWIKAADEHEDLWLWAELRNCFASKKQHMLGVRVGASDKNPESADAVWIYCRQRRSYGGSGIVEAHSIYVELATNKLDGFRAIELEIHHGSLWGRADSLVGLAASSASNP